MIKLSGNFEEAYKANLVKKYKRKATYIKKTAALPNKKIFVIALKKYLTKSPKIKSIKINLESLKDKIESIKDALLELATNIGQGKIND